MRRILMGLGMVGSFAGTILAGFLLIDALTKVHEMDLVPALLVTGVAVLCIGALIRFD